MLGVTAGDSVDILSFPWLCADSVGGDSFGILLGIGVSSITLSEFESGMS